MQCVRTDCLDTQHQECMARTHVSRKIPFSCLPEPPRVSVQSRSRDSPQENDGIPFTIPTVGRRLWRGHAWRRYCTLPVACCLASWQNCEKRLLDSSYLSFRLSVRKEQHGSHWTDFHEIWHLEIFKKSVENIQFSLKCNTNNDYFTRISMDIYDISLNSS